jgi:hypothetical protein
MAVSAAQGRVFSKQHFRGSRNFLLREHESKFAPDSTPPCLSGLKQGGIVNPGPRKGALFPASPGNVAVFFRVDN